MIELRPYQADGIARIREAFGALRKRAPLYVLPTGGGKTLTFATIAHGAATKGNRVYILSNRIELVDQISDALDLSGTPHGYIASGYPKFKHGCMIASVPTLLRRLDKVAPPDLIVIDEAHHSVSSTWARILTYWPNARLLGVTATPLRASGEGLGKIFDHLIVGPSIADLTEQGYLAPARIFAPPTVDTSGLHSRAGDFIAKESEALLDTPSVTGDALSHYKKHADGLPALAFCVSVRHAKHLAEQFRAAGYPAMELDGGTPREIRRGVVADFRAGRIKVLTSCDLFSEGFDCPGVHVGIMLRPTQSLALHCQQIGRVLRPCEGKTHAIILDHAGNTQRHGLPDEPREWSLAGDDPAGRRKPSASVRICASCFCALPSQAKACSECGYEFPAKPREIEQRDGELAEVTPEMLAKRAERREQGQAQSLEALMEIARRKSYRPGWAQHVYQARLAKQRRQA